MKIKLLFVFFIVLTVNVFAGNLNDTNKIIISEINSEREVIEIRDSMELNQIRIIPKINNKTLFQELNKYLQHCNQLCIDGSYLDNIDTLFDSFTFLHELNFLILCNLRDYKIPEKLFECVNLEVLFLDDCKNLQQLSPNFKLLKNLFQFRIYAPLLQKIPKEIFDLQRLNRLELGLPKLKRFPSNISRLNNLERLILYCPNLQKLPKKMYNLKSLKELTLRSVNGKLINRSFERYTSLTYICLDSIVDIDLISTFNIFSRILNLKELSIISCSIESLPDEIGLMNGLTDLDLSHNKILKLNNNMQKLTNLKKISLDLNQLQIFDDFFCRFDSIEVLGLSGNPISVIPECIVNTNLKCLYLYKTKLTINEIDKFEKLKPDVLKCEATETRPGTRLKKYLKEKEIMNESIPKK